MWKLLLMLLMLLLLMKNGHQLLLLMAGQWNRMRLGWHRAGRARGHRGGIDRVDRGTARRRDANVDADVNSTDVNVGDGIKCCGCREDTTHSVIATDVGVAGMGCGLMLLERVLLAEALVADFAAVQFDS